VLGTRRNGDYDESSAPNHSNSTNKKYPKIEAFMIEICYYYQAQLTAILIGLG